MCKNKTLLLYDTFFFFGGHNLPGTFLSFMWKQLTYNGLNLNKQKLYVILYNYKNKIHLGEFSTHANVPHHL
jgi:hypothetical protein